MSLASTQHYIKIAAKELQLSGRLEEMLIKPYRSIKTNVIIELDNGNIATFLGYRVQHNQALGPMKGGIRYHPTVMEEEVESLASLMTWKTSLLRLPYGGAKGGVACDPSKLSEAELERLTKTYVSRIRENVGPYLDIPAPDVNTNAQIMAWFMREYSKHYGFTPAVVTGKPVYLHGSEGREEATGKGVIIVTAELLKNDKVDFKACSFVIQGFGNVGLHAAKEAYKRGAKVIAVSDVNGAIYNPKGLDVEALTQLVADGQSIADYANASKLSNKELLQLKCDVLIPAALGDVFDVETAREVQANYIAEGANGPSSPEADAIFSEKRITVLPDILANAGGVVVSYFEWVQNVQQYKWKYAQIDEALHEFLIGAFYRVNKVAQERKCSLRSAAFILGLGRVAKASLTLGL